MVALTVRDATPQERRNFLRTRVRAQLPQWAAAGAEPAVLKWLQEGYRLPFRGTKPRPYNMGRSFQNATTAQIDFLKEEIQRGIKVGAWERGRSKFINKAFMVPKPGVNKWRLVIDLRPLNRWLQELPMRMETLKHLQRLIRQGDYLLSLDLQDGFYAVAIQPSDRQYLAFEVEGIGVIQLAGLPMGLSSSPYVFTKTVRVCLLFQQLKRQWRSTWGI